MSEEFRRSAPVALAPKPFNIPLPFETVLSNGLKVVVVENKKLPLVNFRLVFNQGQIDDPHDAPGLISAVTALLTEGTETLSSSQLADKIERIGAHLSASSSSDTTVISASSLSIHTEEILNLLADVLLNPAFPENELSLYKQNTIEGLKVQRAEAGFLANERVSKIIFGEHPYSFTSPTPENVEDLTREKIAAHHQKIFIPNAAKLIAVGDVDAQELVAELEKLFAGWKQGEKAETNFPAPPARTAKTLTIVDRPGSAQSNIVISNLAVERHHPDYFSILLMNQILGAGASSRLFMNLREEKGYTYGAYSSFDLRRLAGAFEATAEVRTSVTGDSLREFFYEIEKIRDEKVADKDLQDARNYLTGVFPIRAETLSGLTALIVAQQIYDLPDDYLQTYRDKVNAVTIEDVHHAAQKYLTPDKCAVVIVGDAAEILEQVKLFAETIEIYDTKGDSVDMEKYMNQENEQTADVAGNWNLTLDFQGQSVPVSLDLTQDGGAVEGEMKSMLGTGNISGKVTGNNLMLASTLDFQGQQIGLNVIGTIEENKVSGEITSSMPGLPPISFTGERTA